MDTGKTLLENERRVMRSSDVVAQIYFTNGIRYYFKTFKEDHPKYCGYINANGDGIDSCSCADFRYNMKYEKLRDGVYRGESLFVSEHGYRFQCKHIIAVKRMIGMDFCSLL